MTCNSSAENAYRSVKVAEIQANVGDIIELAPVDNEVADAVGPPLALLQAMWQTKKGKCCL